MTADIFFKAEVARILEIPQTTVKSWTIGLPLNLHPHRSGLGKGSRNIYSVNDLYRFSFANQLRGDGIAPSVIQSVLDELGQDFESLKFVLVTSEVGQRRKNDTKIRLEKISHSQFEKEQWEAVSSLANSFGAHVVHVAAIIHDVDRRVEKFLRKTFGRRSTAPQSDALAESEGTWTRKFRLR
jgi:DNA-binding transcriptional MerR regulator